MTKDELTEAGRIVNEINNLKIKLNDLLDMCEDECWNEDDTWSTKQYLYDYTHRIDEAETELFAEVKLPHCEWAE